MAVAGTSRSRRLPATILHLACNINNSLYAREAVPEFIEQSPPRLLLRQIRPNAEWRHEEEQLEGSPKNVEAGPIQFDKGRGRFADHLHKSMLRKSDNGGRRANG